MSDLENNSLEEIHATFHVDENCIDCDLCRETAPENFTRSDDEGTSSVSKQPADAGELALCREAKEACPVEAIVESSC